MPKFTNIGTVKDERDKVLLQTGKALYSMDSTRQILKNYKSLPSVGSPYVLLESVSTTADGEIFGQDTYLNDDLVTYTTDTVRGYNWQMRITVASDDPEDFLVLFSLNRWEDEFYWKYFGKENVSLVNVGTITDSSLPVEAGDFEVRYSASLDFRFFAKVSTTVNTIETIDITTSVVNPDEL